MNDWRSLPKDLQNLVEKREEDDRREASRPVAEDVERRVGDRREEDSANPKEQNAGDKEKNTGQN